MAGPWEKYAKTSAPPWEKYAGIEESNNANLQFVDPGDLSHSVMERQQAAAIQSGAGPQYTKQEIDDGKSTEAKGLLSAIPVGTMLRTKPLIDPFTKGVYKAGESVLGNSRLGQSVGNAAGLLKSGVSKVGRATADALKDPEVQKRILTSAIGGALGVSGGGLLGMFGAKALGFLGSEEPRR